MHGTVKALFDAAGQDGDVWSLERPLYRFFLERVSQFTSQLHFETTFDAFRGLELKNRDSDRLTVLGFIEHFSGPDHLFWLDLMRNPASGITARWVLYYDPDDRTRAGKAAALDPWSIERPEALDWRVLISNAESAEDAEAR